MSFMMLIGNVYFLSVYIYIYIELKFIIFQQNTPLKVCEVSLLKVYGV